MPGSSVPTEAASAKPDHVAALERALDRLSTALATAPDDVLPALIAERAAMRDQLRTLREALAGNVVPLRALQSADETAGRHVGQR